ncbi:SMC family ATPase, partial [Oscillibacter sp.]|uniref:SMC family ATPase n=1 Tax=Oscillibacter sp. TaxID=1945593 RepID=UPI002D7E9EE5
DDVEALDAKDQLTEHDGPAECLSRWLETNDITGEKAARLMELAAPIIKQADDGREDSKHAGAFMPRTIEVKNYRSYTEAAFDFSPVHMAMVNGPNGVGKSSLFMDAIADCLYEQTRKEDIGGWVRDGTKSGSITFSFALGGQDYQVIRTRTRSGRGTLALQRWNPEADAWADESDTTMKLTQARIERLLGMDCNTFCSIALIRQDAYGLFLDADSDRRMEVLSALLGLDIYGRMEDIAKASATEQRRAISALKERINILGEQTSQKDELLAEDAVLEEEIDDATHDVASGEADLRALESAEALLAEVLRQAEDKDAQSREYDRERDRKALELEKLEGQYQDARHLANGLRAAQSAAERVKEARQKLQELSPKVERDKELLKELSRLRGEISRSDLDAAEGRRKLQQYRDIIAKKPDVEAAQAAIDALAPAKAEAQERLSKSAEAIKALLAAREAKDKHLADSRVRIGELQARLDAAQAEAGKLADSGCPVPETATCKFLTSAVEAQAAIPELSRSLEAMKAEDRARHEELVKAYNDVLAEHEALGKPADDLAELDTKEREYRAVAAIAPQIAAAEAKLEEITASIQEAEARGAEAMRAANKVNAERSELTQAVTEYQDTQKSIVDDEPIASHLGDCQAAGATADALEPQIERLRLEIAELTQKVTTASQEAEDIRQRAPKAPGDAAGLRAVLESRRRSLTEFATQRGVIKAKLDAISEAETQVVQLRREVENAAATLNDYTVLTQAFGLDGIQYMIIRGVVPEIMRRSNDILAAMTGGRMAVDIRTEREQKSTKTVVNSLEVWINTITGGNRPYQSHSGGEKVKIALAVTLGLADVKARRAGVQLGMLFIDEPPFLDADGTEAYADALANMATRNPNMRILAISHDPTMKARFSQNIIVTGGEDGS